MLQSLRQLRYGDNLECTQYCCNCTVIVQDVPEKWSMKCAEAYEKSIETFHGISSNLTSNISLGPASNRSLAASHTTS